MDKTALEFPAPLKRWEMNYNELCDFCVNYHVKVNTLLFNIYYCHVSIFITYVNSARRPKLPCYTYLASMEPPDPPVAGAAAGDFPLTWHRRGCNMMQWLQNPKPCLPWTLSSRNLLPKWSGMTSKTIKTQGRFTSSGSSRPFQALEVQAQFDRILWLSRYVTVCHGISRYVTVCHGMSWYVMVCHGMSWCSPFLSILSIPESGNSSIIPASVDLALHAPSGPQIEPIWHLHTFGKLEPAVMQTAPKPHEVCASDDVTWSCEICGII